MQAERALGRRGLAETGVERRVSSANSQQLTETVPLVLAWAQDVARS